MYSDHEASVLSLHQEELRFIESVMFENGWHSKTRATEDQRKAIQTIRKKMSALSQHIERVNAGVADGKSIIDNRRDLAVEQDPSLFHNRAILIDANTTEIIAVFNGQNAILAHEVAFCINMYHRLRSTVQAVRDVAHGITKPTQVVWAQLAKRIGTYQ